MSHQPWSIDTNGACPFMYRDELFIVEGYITGWTFATLHGTPYLYDDYKWDGKIASREECLSMLKYNSLHTSLIPSDDCIKKMEGLLNITNDIA